LDTAATFLAEVVHVAWFVTVAVVPLLYCAVTVTCFEAPRGILAEVQDMVNEGTAVDGWEVLFPPQPLSTQNAMVARTSNTLWRRVNDMMSPQAVSPNGISPRMGHHRSCMRYASYKWFIINADLSEVVCFLSNVSDFRTAINTELVQ
jgi:hypothetical protein